MSIRLYVGNLPKEEVDRQALQDVFADMGDAVTTKVIKDRKTGKCRGFAFVTVKTDEQADELIEKYNGHVFQDTPLKIEKALPRSKGGPGDEEEARPAAPTHTGGGSPNRNSKNKKSRRSPEQRSTSGDTDSFQPDPRWAGELAKLKEMLAAQASN